MQLPSKYQHRELEREKLGKITSLYKIIFLLFSVYYLMIFQNTTACRNRKNNQKPKAGENLETLPFLLILLTYKNGHFLDQKGSLCTTIVAGLLYCRDVICCLL